METTHKTLLILCLVLLSCPSRAFSQQVIPIVEFKQGKIIGSLPYMEHFYIKGSTMLPRDTAHKVVVEIFELGKYKKNDKPVVLSRGEADEIAKDLGKQVNRSEWYAFRAVDKTNFQVYIDALLPFKRNFLVRVTYFRKFTFALTDEEKNDILETVIDKSKSYYKANDFLDELYVQKTLRQETFEVIAEKTDLLDFGFSSEEANRIILNNIEVIATDVLTDLTALTTSIASNEKIITETVDELNARRLTMETEDIRNIEAEIAARRETNRELRQRLNNELRTVKSQMLIVGREFAQPATNSVSVTNVKSIGTGTSFGGGLVSLNPLSNNNRQMESLGYSGVKFFLAPVDKRVVQPYLDGAFFFNRLAIMVGATTTGDLEYRGQTLESVINFNPLLGFSFDVTRSLSIDFGGTLFRQPSISPLQAQSEVRLGPVLGATFDLDGFNRIKALVNDNPYRKEPVK